MKISKWKRFKKLWVDKSYYESLFFASAISFIVPFLLCPISIMNTLSFSIIFTSSLFILAIILTIACIKADEEAEQQEQQPSYANQSRQEINDSELNAIHLKKFLAFSQSIDLPDETIQSALSHVLLTLVKVCENDSLNNIDYHYVYETLPQDLQKTLSLYLQLSPRHQEEEKQALLDLLHQKANLLQQKYITKQEEAVKKEFQKQIQLTYQRDVSS